MNTLIDYILIIICTYIIIIKFIAEPINKKTYIQATIDDSI